MTTRSPFYAGTHNGIDTEYISSDDRIRVAKNFTRAQCEAALQLPNLQKTVERAVRARLRQLEKETTR